MAAAHLAGVVAVVLLAARAVAGAAEVAPCAGRFLVTRATGTLVSAAGDVIALDGANAVLDPACGAAVLQARITRNGTRLRARWRDCRARRHVTLRVRASADCTVLRGGVSGGGARSRVVALRSRCGDGRLDAGRGERCDDGNFAPDDACNRCGACNDPATLTSTWAAIQANVFDRECSSCHRDDAATGGLDLRAPGSHARLVGVPSHGGDGRLLVAPADRNASYLWLKTAKGTLGGLLDLPGSGMPIGSVVAADMLEAMGRWIDAGAPADGFVAGAEALRPPCP